VVVVLLVMGCDPVAEPGGPEGARSSSTEPARAAPPPRLEARTDGGHYRVTARPADGALVLHRMHDWIVGIELSRQDSEVPTAVHFDGGMPAHDHGFVTRPRVTRNLGGGEFLVEGVKFHMPGDWVLQITVASRGGAERATLPLAIEP
jgi:hypothetical protein